MGKEADMRAVEPLPRQLAERGIRPMSVAMDKSYDYQACQTHGTLPVVAARTNSGTDKGSIDRDSNTFKRLYHARSAVERELGRLKHHLGLTPLRVRRLQRVRLHADPCLLTRLALAILNSRT
ncbi:MAG: transposase [Actinomycetia bacterium]|nr:transposase [Actinomycetes bacterium]